MLLNRVFNEDCLLGMHKIPDNSVDFILTDLPYGTTQCKWDVVLPFTELWAEYKRVLKPSGVVALTGTEPFSSLLRMSNLKMYKYDWVWDKIKGTGHLNAKKQPMRCYENISVFYTEQCTYNPQKTQGHTRKKAFKRKHLQSDVYGQTNSDTFYDSTERYPRNIISISTDTQKSSLHSTQKPLALFEYLINTYTNLGDVVLDSCCGSGTTAIACLTTGRNYICFEKDTDIYYACVDRINTYHLFGS